MTKTEAKKTIAMLTSGTLAALTGLRRYDDLDQALWKMLDVIDETDVSQCENWVDVWENIKGGVLV